MHRAPNGSKRYSIYWDRKARIVGVRAKVPRQVHEMYTRREVRRFGSVGGLPPIPLPTLSHQ
ncbi:hypothetical protein GA0070618_4267 [Micromonospora echinospora]|uniref:Uncharacterized protein n=1 Tax=Micromonospora echinospora TaxID=1877 RepID=A0A1C4YR21_MICEC|nr:hypothetical protein GA0070618_4267 [Micromonospora echinospora]